jgi:TolB-like protein
VSETRKLAAILVADIVGYSRLAGTDEDRILARLRTLRSDLIDPILAVHHGRVVKRTGDGAIVEFRLSKDPDQDYFADGITENLTTELSRFPNSFVIARNTAFTYKGKSVDAKEIGKELDVRYVLEGSVQRDQNRVRVNAQLIDTESGAHLWADRFEEDVSDLFKLQDQVVARLANSLGYELVKAEAEKASRSKNPDAVDLTMRGRALLSEAGPSTMKDTFDAALDLFDQALNIDPNDADALVGEAYTNIYLQSRGWLSGADVDAKIIGQLDRAIALAPENLWAYEVKSEYLAFQRPSEAVSTADAGLAINPNSSSLHESRGLAENYRPL